jgi:hypothetical protein
MNRITVFIFAVIVWLGMTTVAITGLPPTTLNSWLSTVRQTTFNFFVPGYQATRVTGGTLIETGNTNLLINPGFEHSTIGTGWTCAVTGTATCTLAADATIKVDDGGKQAVELACAGGASGGNCTLTQNVTTVYDVQGLVRIFARTQHAGFSVCSMVDAAESQCVTVPDAVNTYSRMEIPVITGTTSTGIRVKVTAGASESKVTRLDNAFVGVQNVITTSSPITPWVSAGAMIVTATTTNPTKGTIVRDIVSTRQVGDSLEINIDYVQTLTGGAAGSGTYLITLPNSHAFDLGKIAANTTMTNDSFANDRNRIGEGTFQQAGGFIAKAGAYAYDSTRFYIKLENAMDAGSGGGFANSGDTWSSSITNLAFNANMGFKLRIVAPIANLSGSVSTYSSSCGAECVDTFSAKVSGTGAITDPNVSDWLTSCTNANPRVCTFKTNLFTVAPNCQATPFVNSSTREATIWATSLSSVSVYTNDSAGGPSAIAFNLSCQKTGADFIATRTITGSFKEVVTTPGVTRPVFASAQISATGVVSNEKGDLVNGNCSVASTSDFSCAFTTGRFANAPNCVAVIQTDLGSANSRIVHVRNATSTTLTYYTQIAGSPTALPVSVSCHGEAP